MENIPTSASSNVFEDDPEGIPNKLHNDTPRKHDEMTEKANSSSGSNDSSLPIPPPQDNGDQNNGSSNVQNLAAVMPPLPPATDDDQDTEDEIESTEDNNVNSTTNGDGHVTELSLPSAQSKEPSNSYTKESSANLNDDLNVRVVDRGIIVDGEFNFADDESEGIDEWDNDDDPGVVMIPISEDEFLDLEMECYDYDEEEDDEAADNEKAYTDEDIAVAIDVLNHSSDDNDPRGEKKTLKDTFGKEVTIMRDDEDEDDLDADLEDAEHMLSQDSATIDIATTTPDGNQERGDMNPTSSIIVDDAATTAAGNDGDNKRELKDVKNVTKIEDTSCERDSTAQELAQDAARALNLNDDDEEEEEEEFEDDIQDDDTTDDQGDYVNGRFGEVPAMMGQKIFRGCDGDHCIFNLKVIFDPFRTGFENSKHFVARKGDVIAGRYQVTDMLGQAAFSTAIQCFDTMADNEDNAWVCLKVIKNNKDFFDQSLDEIKLLQYINTSGDPEKNHVLTMLDFFYYKEHLFIVSELLRENLYEFGKYIRDNNLEPYFTLSRLKKISKQVLEALDYIHRLKLIHCDLKPENIVIKSYSRCEVKLIDFGSSCFITDQLSSYIQSRSYRAPEVILGTPYDYKIDVWSYGAVLAEMITGYVLFQNDSIPTMLSRITGILGPFPEHVLRAGKETPAFFTANNIVYDRIGPNSSTGPGSGNGERRHGWNRRDPMDRDETLVLIHPKKTTLGARLHLKGYPDGSDEDMALDFVRYMLDLDPLTRPTAADVLQHPWLHDADHINERWDPNAVDVSNNNFHANMYTADGSSSKDQPRGHSV